MSEKSRKRPESLLLYGKQAFSAVEKFGAFVGCGIDSPKNRKEEKHEDTL